MDRQLTLNNEQSNLLNNGLFKTMNIVYMVLISKTKYLQKFLEKLRKFHYYIIGWKINTIRL